jgi:hypothetical protein
VLRCWTLFLHGTLARQPRKLLSLFSNDVKLEAGRVQLSAETVVACSDLAEAQRLECMRYESLLSQADRALFVFHNSVLGDA